VRAQHIAAGLRVPGQPQPSGNTGHLHGSARSAATGSYRKASL